MKALQVYNVLLGAILTIAVFASYSTVEDPEKPATEEKVSQVIEAIPLNKPFDFAGEPFPLTYNDVKERLDRELIVNTYWHSSTLLNIKNSHKYFPLIEPILAQHGIPDDFKYLAVAESSLRNVTSPAGAKGIWQFMEKTGKGYGLEINGEVDQRYHIEKSTEAACKLLKDYKDRFGSWTLAAAAYNGGETRLARYLAEQRAKTYFDLNMAEETMRYVFRLVALKEILSHPKKYGFYLENQDFYVPMDDFILVQVDAPIANLGDFASEQGISYRTLKRYNPWMRSTKLSNKEGKKYLVKIPK